LVAKMLAKICWKLTGNQEMDTGGSVIWKSTPEIRNLERQMCIGGGKMRHHGQGHRSQVHEDRMSGQR